MQGQPIWAIALALGLLTVAGLAIGLGAVLTILWLLDQVTKKSVIEHPLVRKDLT